MMENKVDWAIFIFYIFNLIYFATPNIKEFYSFYDPLPAEIIKLRKMVKQHLEQCLKVNFPFSKKGHRLYASTR